MFREALGQNGPLANQSSVLGPFQRGIYFRTPSSSLLDADCPTPLRIKLLFLLRFPGLLVLSTHGGFYFTADRCVGNGGAHYKPLCLLSFCFRGGVLLVGLIGLQKFLSTYVAKIIEKHVKARMQNIAFFPHENKIYSCQDYERSELLQDKLGFST